ncbi:hypothetical protein TraAM80_09595 [Trypanosoma rangeli]|uniref:Mucin-associated surface protein (MASP) n=1 Tax=Trypanosoma rangeli TaxID=5698 RepID=A0A422MUL4_TRYRA|nr:uncharacterized protein TraAM80_09595 [Trypanosoma rangeli]RNE96869.1 hypothetical protein TraAM80_09595 [Trypanosoma rangeli]|eukprot:RNE96869.1 hypothetical protein TraAM80_09595 [Trypanosoma rangeli]
MAGRVLLVCALCVLCCGGGVGAWGGDYCTESDWRGLRAVARDMSEAEIEGQYCGRKPEFVQRLRASLQAETKEHQDEKAKNAPDTDEKAQQGKQNEQHNAGAPGVSQTNGAPSEMGGDSGRGQSLGSKGVSPSGKDGAGSTSQSGGSTSPTEDGAPRTDKTVSPPAPPSKPSITTLQPGGGEKDVIPNTTSESSPPVKQDKAEASDGEEKTLHEKVPEQQQKTQIVQEPPPATPNAPTPPTGQSGEAEEKTTSADGQSKANEGNGGEARVEDITQNTQTTVVGGHAGATQQNSPAVGGGAASSEAERRAVDDAAKGGVEETTAASATISVGTNAAKPVPGDSDSGSAASHCTSPVALLLLFACAVAAAMAAA